MTSIPTKILLENVSKAVQKIQSKVSSSHAAIQLLLVGILASKDPSAKANGKSIKAQIQELDQYTMLENASVKRNLELIKEKLNTQLPDKKKLSINRDALTKSTNIFVAPKINAEGINTILNTGNDAITEDRVVMSESEEDAENSEDEITDESYQPLPKKKKNTPQMKRKKTKANGRSISKKDTLPRRIEKENNQDLSRDASPRIEDNEPPTDLNTQKQDLNNNVEGENDNIEEEEKKCNSSTNTSGD